MARDEHRARFEHRRDVVDRKGGARATVGRYRVLRLDERARGALPVLAEPRLDAGPGEPVPDRRRRRIGAHPADHRRARSDPRRRQRGVHRHSACTNANGRVHDRPRCEPRRRDVEQHLTDRDQIEGHARASPSRCAIGPRRFRIASRC